MSKLKDLISIVSPTYNEEDNITELYSRIIEAIKPLKNKYDFEIIIIDNSSTDSTVARLKEIAEADKQVKIIVNIRNFGHIRSPYYGILQSSGKATIYLASDLQDPPELIPQFIEAWENGYKLVLGIKPVSAENQLFHHARRAYYAILDMISDISIVRDSTGFGLYDAKIVKILREIGDPYPFLRGLVAELGFPAKLIKFNQARRLRGVTKNNFYSLYDIAWLGAVSHSRMPMRFSAFVGIVLGGLSIIASLLFFVLKILFWDKFPFGIAPIIIGMFMLFGIQFIFMSILGEYVGSILYYVQKRPIVIEKERVNFD